jgi:predicted nucleotide-binding protein (sugar kinase/HSP70/actin superfamily)
MERRIKMKVTFPHMGTMEIAVKTLLQELGLEVVSPPQITQKTLDLGVKHAPELACLPLKINIGNYIEALEKGADTIIMGGGAGPCRFGYYGEVQEKILEDLDYDFEMIVLEPIQDDWLGFYKKLKLLLTNISWFDLKEAWQKGWAKATAVDALTEKVDQIRAYARDRKKASQIYEAGLAEIDSLTEIEQIKQAEVNYQDKLDELPQRENFQPLRVGVVGEIYVVLEPFVNFEIEKKLGERGIVVDKSISLTEWIREHLYLGFFKDDTKQKKIKELAQPYLNHKVGGHGLETIGETVKYAREEYDGVIHLSPFTCMPEIIAKSILPRVSEEEDIAVLSLTVDEHTGEAGVITRMEAFIDLLAQKNSQKLEKNQEVIS